MGEYPEAITDGTQDALMESVTSVNIACGGHAGDESTMAETIRQALRHGVAVGAHPGYPDKPNFGRLELEVTLDVIADFVYEQVSAFARIAAHCGAQVAHVKAHGALYNQAVHKREIAHAIAAGVGRWQRGIPLVGLANSPMLDAFREADFPVVAEAFADRRYELDGTLRNRKHPDALLREPEAAALQALEIAERGVVTCRDGSTIPMDAQTICIHGDTPGAIAIAKAVAARLRAARVQLMPL
jgi:UPF0271 protein